ncbi:MAG: HD domain-containing protein [Ruminococcus sp.]|nr:HD domain-containing protein [Ruminococcus sp.]
MLDEVKNKVYELLKEEDSAHDINHINRVYELAIKFAKEENANLVIVGLAALLHDVDDYKLVGKENANKFLNTKRILKEVNASVEVSNTIIDIIKNMGYSKCLKGIRPKTIEGMCVSDADMCDVSGTIGIVRTITYHLSSKGNKVIFDRNLYPKVNITAEEYTMKGTTHDTDGAINHCFEKILKVKKLMMTSAGKKEAENRHEFIISFLRQFFKEENAPEWEKFLDNYLENLN